MATATKTNPAEAYASALDRAKKDGCLIIADHTENGIHVAYVWNPKGNGVYCVKIFRDHMACECKAYTYCKHRAIVREAQIAAMTPAAKAVYTAALTQSPRKASNAPTPTIRGFN